MEMSLTEAATLSGVTRQAIHLSIKRGKLEATKREGRWVITTQQLEDYRKKKYTFDKEKGLFSLTEAANILGCSLNHLYQASYARKLKSYRKGFSWVVHIDDIMDYKNRMKKRNNGL